MDRDTETFEAGNISLEKYREVRRVWLDSENGLS